MEFWKLLHQLSDIELADRSWFEWVGLTRVWGGFRSIGTCIIGSTSIPQPPQLPRSRREVAVMVQQRIGCKLAVGRTGAAISSTFKRMSIIGEANLEKIKQAWESSMKDVLAVSSQNDIPELNIYQCGSYKMHSLEEAHAIADKILKADIELSDNNDLLLSDKQLADLQTKAL